MTNGLKQQPETEEGLTAEEALSRMQQLKQETQSAPATPTGNPLGAIADRLKEKVGAIGGSGEAKPKSKPVTAKGHGLSLTTGNEFGDDFLHLFVTTIIFTGLTIYMRRMGHNMQTYQDGVYATLILGTVFSRNRYAPMRAFAFLFAGFLTSNYLLEFIYK